MKLIVNKPIAKIIDLINSGHERTVKAKKNIIVSFLTKGLNIVIGFIQVPIAIEYLGSTKYGLWLIIGSVISWFGFFDIGLGNGMRNKFAEALAKNDKQSAKTYISTTYAILSIIMILLVLIFFSMSPFLDWYRILNAPADINENILLVVYIVFVSFALRFVLKLITTILVADQRPAIQGVINVIRRVINLLILIILLKTTSGSLVYMALTFSITPILILIFASIYFYSKDYKEFIPSLNFVDFKYARDLMTLGVRFFIIQIAVLVLYTTDNMIITQLYDPSQVTVYNIANKYFSIVTMGFTIVITPFWSSVTEAYHKNDIPWIKKSIRQLIRIWVLFLILTIVMLFMSNWVYKVWVGPEILVPFNLSITWAIFVAIFSFNFIFIYFINGTGKVKFQLYLALINMVINIPLSIFFAKVLNFGISGVIMGTLVSAVLSFIFAPIQYKKIISGKATGIWNK